MNEDRTPHPWWCATHDDDDPHARCTSIVSSGDPTTETRHVAVLLWRPQFPVGMTADGAAVWSPERVAVDVSDGDDETPAVILSPARARSLAAALVRAADLSEGGPPIL